MCECLCAPLCVFAVHEEWCLLAIVIVLCGGILLTTKIAALMFLLEAMLCMKGYQCVPTGVNTPCEGIGCPPRAECIKGKRFNGTDDQTGTTGLSVVDLQHLIHVLLF